MWNLQIAIKSRTIALCRVVGIMMFFTAFPLPSVRIPLNAQWNNFAGPAVNSAVLPQSGSAHQQPLTLRGIHCAGMSLFADVFIFRSSAQERRTIPFWMFLAAASGWSNLLVAVYVPFSFSRRFFKLRFSLSVAIALCLAATVIIFVTTPIVPLPGYFLWFSGILLFIVPLAELL
jgi:hypothetical protein